MTESRHSEAQPLLEPKDPAVRSLLAECSGGVPIGAWRGAGDGGTRRPGRDPLTGHTEAVRSVVVQRLGGREVIVSGGGMVQIWDEHAVPVGDPLTGHTRTVSALAVGRLGGREVIVSGGSDETVRIWDEHGTPIGNPTPLLEPARAVAIHPAGVVLAVGPALCMLQPIRT
jgi:WD40 repeat protein